ncbi:MAG: glycosyltransferase family 4 protein [Lachnospiraceae bacterium]|nr:glycosyltransferase family 4 protein [Lachnospiraceae bacterium]
MNIFFYINILAGGGAERVVANLASSFSDRGHKVSVVTSYRVENEYMTGKKVKRYVLENKKSETGFISRNLRRIVKLRQLLVVNRPDLLISFMAEPNFRSIIATRFLKTKVIVSVRNDPSKEYPTKIMWFLANLLFKKADGIIFQTQDAKDCFNKIIQERSEIISNQVNSIFYSTMRAERTRNIITVGRLTAQKNHKILIEAFDIIKSRINDNLIIYGEGPAREELERMIKEKGLGDRVFLPGNVSNIENHLAAAKLFVLSSDYEGMPNALMEAMAVGVPCISTDCPCGGPRMLIEDGVNGLLVPVDDKEALDHALLLLLTDERLANKVGMIAKERSKVFAPKSVGDRWIDYINSIND